MTKTRWSLLSALKKTYVPTNNYLLNINKAESAICIFCEIDEESIDYLFYKCNIVKKIVVWNWRVDVNTVWNLNSIWVIFRKLNNKKNYKFFNFINFILKQNIFFHENMKVN